MKKRIGGIISNAKFRISMEFRGINMPFACICGVVVLICGFTTVILGAGDISVCTLIMPRYTLPVILTVLFRMAVYLFLGLSFAMVISCRERARQLCICRGAALLSLLLLTEFLWFPLIYGVCAPFLAFLDMLLMLTLTVMLICMFYRVYFTVTLALVLHLIFLLCRFWWNASLMFLN